MKSQQSSTEASRRPLLLRRVVGYSMLPALQPGQLVVATSLLPIREGDVVVAVVDGRDVIKRVAALHPDAVELHGDNQSASTDSRSYGLLPRRSLYGRVIFTSGRQNA